MTAPTEKLRPFTRLAYGAGELGPAMAGSTMIFFQFVFLTTVAGLRADLAGYVLLAGKLWDAFNDPLIGWLSDHTRSRWGRRLPWMAASALPFAVAFWLQWIVPGFLSPENQWGLFAYYVVVSVIYNTFYTGLSLPHSALTAELTHDYDERSRLTGFRMGFSLGGSVGGLVLKIVVFGLMAAAPAAMQYSVFGAVVAALGVLAVAACIGGIWRPVIAAEQVRNAIPPVAVEAPSGLAEQWKILLSNRPYLMVCAIYLFSWLAMQFTAAILPIYVSAWLQQSAQTYSLLALAVQGTALLLIPLWSLATVRIGKKAVYLVGMVFWLVAQGGLFFVQPGQAAFVFALGIIAGFGISVCYLIPNAMLPDTIEYDELRTGQRREGVFYGFFVFLQKCALALGSAILGWILQASGYLSTSAGETVAQPDSALLAIRLLIGPLPALAILVGMFFAWRFPITKKKHAEILRQLVERRRELQS